MPPQESFLHQDPQARQQANEQRFGEMASAIDELRRQLTDVQTEMERQTALYDLERTQLQKERRAMHEERLRMANLLGDKLQSATETEQAVRLRMKTLQDTLQMIKQKNSTLLACSQANTVALRDYAVERYEEQPVASHYLQERQRVDADAAARAFEERLQITERVDLGNDSDIPIDPRTDEAFSEYCNIQEMQQFWDERHRVAAASQSSTENHQGNDKVRWDLKECIDSTDYMKSSTSFMESYPLAVMKLHSFIEEIEKLVETPKSSRDIHFYRKLKSKNRLMRMSYRVFFENLKRYGTQEDVDRFRELDEKSLNVLERANKELDDLKKIKMFRYTFNAERAKQMRITENK
ncbi:uncharacterized protein LOC131671782 isoform X2 [Phymastichus coffea]|uniref:uncharacterized protein LOC131671782 isoform X2 n=1 Tax=Phymastichus coffea TaxID=108790 RepID=UPI00273AC041|nr:uncharacterized protein LOC131671782 isoform X2 [Phymastichus coffea]